MNLSRTVFVGQGPNKTAWTRAGQLACIHEIEGGLEFAVLYCARLALTGAVGRKIGLMLDMDGHEFFALANRRNLNCRWNGKNGKGDKFDRFEGEVTAQMLLKAGQFDDFVLFGAEVTKCFNIPFIPPLNILADEVTRKRFLIMPHPSGIVRWWNSKENHGRARHALRSFLNVPNP